MKSLRGQLIARLLASGALLLGVSSAFLYWLICHALTVQFDAALEAKAQWLASMTEQRSGRMKMELGDGPGIRRGNDSEFFSIKTSRGGVIAESEQKVALAAPRGFLRLNAPAFFDAVTQSAQKMRCVALRFTPREDDEDETSNHPKANAIVVFGRDRASLNHIFKTVGYSLLGTCAGVLGVIVLLVRWNIGTALKPLDRLGKNVETMNASSLGTRLVVHSVPAELQPITGRLNELFARLEAAFARERRFTDSVAHELRTPLAELRALAEVNLSAPATEAERLDSFRDILAASSRMESLALRLLELTRTEEGTHALRRERVSLGEAVPAAWNPHAAGAEKRGMTTRFDIPAEMEICTDAAILLAVLGNLFANAVAHAPQGSPFSVEAFRSNEEIKLTFGNQAGDLTEADVSRLFERFWRKDTARSDASHHGLGLSLAAEFSAILGGELTARLSREGCLEFLLTLPASEGS